MPTTKHRRGLRRACLVVPLSLSVIVVLIGAAIILTRIFPATQTLAVTSPVCGTWKVFPERDYKPPILSGIQDVSFNAVAAVDGTIWAAGNFGRRTGGEPLLAQLYEDTWRLIVPPEDNVSGERQDAFYILNTYGIAAISPEDVWAVGGRDLPVPVRTATLHWDGTTWTVIPSASVSVSYNNLTGVAAMSKRDVWAVGYYGHYADSYSALAMRWDGIQWRIVETPSPRPDSDTVELARVVALSTNDVWAVGHVGYYDPRPTGSIGPRDRKYQTLAMHWDGLKWRVVPTPNLCQADNRLTAISAVAPDDVWAVGSCTDAPKLPYRVLIEHWDGIQWSIIASPSTARSQYLTGVSSVSPNDVWAVGFRTETAKLDQVLALHWDGAQWTTVPTPTNSERSQAFRDVVALPGGDVWAVGRTKSKDDDYGFEKPLIERFVRCSPKSGNPASP